MWTDRPRDCDHAAREGDSVCPTCGAFFGLSLSLAEATAWAAFKAGTAEIPASPSEILTLIDRCRDRAKHAIALASNEARPQRCYCCTCDEDPHGYANRVDPYCRNHGHAGTRVCVRHESTDRGQGRDENGRTLADVQHVHKAGSWIKADRDVQLSADVAAPYAPEITP